MKKQISLFLVLLLVLSLSGCREKEDIQFYYPRTEIQYDTSEGVITAESRNIEGTDRSLEFLLKLYLEGPVSRDLTSPFPRGTALEDLLQTEDTITVTLSEPFGLLENLDYITACACVATTCFALTDADSVSIVSGQTEMTLTRKTLSLTDQTDASIPD